MAENSLILQASEYLNSGQIISRSLTKKFKKFKTISISSSYFLVVPFMVRQNKCKCEMIKQFNIRKVSYVTFTIAILKNIRQTSQKIFKENSQAHFPHRQ
jgi:hypothetical protein